MIQLLLVILLPGLRCVAAARFQSTNQVTPTPIGTHRVISNFSIPGEYYSIDFPPNPSNLLHSRSSCFDFARHGVEEPFTSHYWPRENFTLVYPWTEVKRAYWQWDGPIKRADFEAVRSMNCNAKFYETVHYKIVNRRLYTPSACQACTQQGFACTPRRALAEEVLKVVLYLWPLPDMEFMMYFGDNCFPERPIISVYVCRNPKRGGFSMPTPGIWSRSLGPVQMAAYHSCLRHRYPSSRRKPQVVWRGGSTNPFPIRKDNYLQAPRVLLHLLSRNHSDILDTKLVRLTPVVDPWVRAFLNDTAEPMPIEDYNRYCAVADLDGNGWTDRFGHSLIHFPTPILKYATNRTAYFEHYYAPGVTFMQYNPDFSDFLEKARKLVDDCKTRGSASAGQRLVDNMLRQTRAYMDHMGIAESLAYTLHAFKNQTTWPLDPSLEGFTEVNMTCCTHTRLPQRFAQLVSSRLEAADPEAAAAAAEAADAAASGG